jgi:hypothetical protein
MMVGVIPLAPCEERKLQQPKVSGSLLVVSKNLVETIYEVKPTHRYQITKDKERWIENPYDQK